MKKLKLTRIIASLLLTVSALALHPTGASAEWKDDSNGWWYLNYDSSWATGWKKIDGKWYCFNSDGYMLHDTTVEGCRLGADGAWIQEASNYNWVEANGNTYFKVKDNYVTGVWNIDGTVYVFDKNGIMVKGEYTFDGVKYLFGSDGKYIKCLDKDNWRLYASNAVTTGNTNSLGKNVYMKAVSQDSNVTFHLDWYPLKLERVYSYDPEKAKTTTVGTGHNAKTVYTGATLTGNTLNCRTGETIMLRPLEVGNTANWSTTPSLLIKGTSTNDNIAVLGFDLAYADGYIRLVTPYIIAKNVGKTTLTIDINGTTTSIDVTETE